LGRRIDKLERTMPDESKVTLAVIQTQIQHLTQTVEQGFSETSAHLTRLNGKVQGQETRITVLEKSWEEQVQPILIQVVENRMEIVKVVAGGAGFGGVVISALAMMKALGVW
jgi:hypothetical protein